MHIWSYDRATDERSRKPLQLLGTPFGRPEPVPNDVKGDDGHDREDCRGSQRPEVQIGCAIAASAAAAGAPDLRKFALCRLCFRKLALQGDVAGVTKSSW